MGWKRLDGVAGTKASADQRVEITNMPRLGKIAATTVMAVVAGLVTATTATASPVGVQALYQVTYGSLGRADFDSYGEILRACDTREDGLDVNANLTVQGRTYSVSDSGAGSPCGQKNLDLPEGLSGTLQVCVPGRGCNSTAISTT